MTLIINIHDIRDVKSAQLRGTRVVEAAELDLPELPDIVWNPLWCTYEVTNAGNLFVFLAKLEGPLTMECSRCLQSIAYPLEVEVEEQFSRHPQGDDDNIFFGEEIDVTGVLRDGILLNLPAKPLCFPDCQGLCPHCGTDLNQGSCDCNPQQVDPRLAVLEKLIRK